MARWASVSAAILSLAVIATPAAAGSTYRFEDGEGVVHYTNVPSDPRYGFVRRDPEPERAKPAADAGGSPRARGAGLRAPDPHDRRAPRCGRASRRGDRPDGVGREPDRGLAEGRPGADAAHAGARRRARRAGLLRSRPERRRRGPTHARPAPALRRRRDARPRRLQRRRGGGPHLRRDPALRRDARVRPAGALAVRGGGTADVRGRSPSSRRPSASTGRSPRTAPSPSPTCRPARPLPPGASSLAVPPGRLPSARAAGTLASTVFLPACARPGSGRRSAGWPPSGVAAVERAVGERLGHVVGGDPVGARQVGDRPGHPEDAVVAAGREAQP